VHDTTRAALVSRLSDADRVVEVGVGTGTKNIAITPKDLFYRPSPRRWQTRAWP